MKNIKLALIDDDALIISLLKDFFQKQEFIDVIYTAESGEEFIEQLNEAKQQPDIVVLDLKMKQKSGVEVTSYLKNNFPEIRSIVMSSHYQKSFMGFMLKTGVAAFIPKGILPDELVKIIFEVMEKGFCFLPDQVESLREQVSPKSPKPVLDKDDVLTKREKEILRLICHQKTAKEIGEELFIATSTVEGHKNNLFLKTETKNLAGLVIYAIQNGIITADEVIII